MEPVVVLMNGLFEVFAKVGKVADRLSIEEPVFDRLVYRLGHAVRKRDVYLSDDPGNIHSRHQEEFIDCTLIFRAAVADQPQGTVMEAELFNRAAKRGYRLAGVPMQ